MALTTILASIPRTRIKSTTWRTLNLFGISRSSPTRRGCRSGRRKKKALFICDQIPQDSLTSDISSFPILPRIELQHRGHLRNTSSNLLNSQIVTSPSGDVNNDILDPHNYTLDPAGFFSSAGQAEIQQDRNRVRDSQNLVYVRRNLLPTPPRKSLQFGNVNARSLKNKTEVFTDHVINGKLDICLVTETWIKNDDSVTLAALSPQGYMFRNVPRHSERTGGGTGIILRENFKINFIEGNLRLSFESSEWNVTAYGRTSKSVTVNRPPYSDAHPVPTGVFFQEFTVYLESILLCPEVLVIGGDFNIHIDDPSYPDTKKFTQLLQTFGLLQHVTFATHISGHWLDLIITRLSNDIMVVSPRPSLFLSDHCFSECILDIPSTSVTVKEVSYRKWKQIDLAAFKDDIIASELYSLPSNELAANYNRVLQAVLDKHAPLQRKVLTVRPRVPWFNDELKQLKGKRQKLEKKMKKSNLPSDVCVQEGM